MRTILRALLFLVLLVVVAVFAFGWWSGRAVHGTGDRPVATSGTIDTTKARARGAEIGEKTAVAVTKVEETAQEAAITAKIKAKMALDDNVQARRVDVHTTGSTVTLSGTVRSTEERARAIRLARETAGVTNVADHLTIGR